MIKPTFFENRMHIDLRDRPNYEDEYIELLRFCFDQPSKRKPPLGKKPECLQPDAAPITNTHSACQRFKDAFTNGKPQAAGHFKEYLRRLQDAIESLLVFEAVPEGDEEKALIQKISYFIPYRHEYIDTLVLLCDYAQDDRHFELIRDTFETALSFEFRQGLMPWHLDAINWVLRELFIYTAAVLVEHKKFSRIEIFTGHQYSLTQGHRQAKGNFALFQGRFRIWGKRGIRNDLFQNFTSTLVKRINICTG